MRLENAKLKSAVRSGTAAKPVNTAQDAEYRAARAELEQLKAQMAQRESDLQQREAEVQSKEQARAELEAQVEQVSTDYYCVDDREIVIPPVPNSVYILQI